MDRQIGPVRRWFAWAIRRGSGYLLAIIGLFWVFHDVQLDRFLASSRAMNWWWLTPAVLCDIVSYLCQGIRWTYLLRPVGALSPLRATQAIYVGLFTNELVPMRLGELVRAYLVARWMGMPLASMIPSILAERLLDGIWLAFGIAGTAILIPLPANMLHGVQVFAMAIVAGVLLFGLLLLFCGPLRPAGVAVETVPRLGRTARIMAFLRRIAVETSRIGSLRILLLSGAFSVGLLMFQALAFWLVMISYGLSLPLGAGFAVFLLVHVGTAIPNAPANIGSFQFFTVLGLTLFGVEKNTAAAFSVTVFLILTVPLWVLGSAALARSGASLAVLRAGIRDGVSHKAA